MYLAAATGILRMKARIVTRISIVRVNWMIIKRTTNAHCFVSAIAAAM
jgi:hypothetical protein